jgi:hypothetical protein
LGFGIGVECFQWPKAQSQKNRPRLTSAERLLNTFRPTSDQHPDLQTSLHKNKINPRKINAEKDFGQGI